MAHIYCTDEEKWHISFWHIREKIVTENVKTHDQGRSRRTLAPLWWSEVSRGLWDRKSEKSGNHRDYWWWSVFCSRNTGTWIASFLRMTEYTLLRVYCRQSLLADDSLAYKNPLSKRCDHRSWEIHGVSFTRLLSSSGPCPLYSRYREAYQGREVWDTLPHVTERRKIMKQKHVQNPSRYEYGRGDRRCEA